MMRSEAIISKVLCTLIGRLELEVLRPLEKDTVDALPPS